MDFLDTRTTSIKIGHPYDITLTFLSLFTSHVINVPVLHHIPFSASRRYCSKKKMQGCKSIPRVPWSRHMGVSIETTHERDFSEGTRSHLKKQTLDWKFADDRTNRRRSSSESNLVKGVKVKIYDDESLDSQSDPGSVSLRNKKSLSSRFDFEDNADCDGGVNKKSYKRTGKKSPIQGRSGQPNKIRRRKGTNNSNKIGDDLGNFVVLMSEHVLPEAFNTSGTLKPQYVHMYFDFLYYSCVSPYKWDRANCNEETTKCQSFLDIVRKIIFGYIALLALFSSFQLVKYFILNFLAERDMNSFIDLGYFMVSSLLQLYLTYFVIFSNELTSKKLQVWQLYESTNTDDTDSNETTKRTKWLPIANGMATIVVALLKTVALYSSFREAIIEYSNETAEALFLWTPAQTKNLTSIHNSFGEELNITTYTTGLIGFMTVFFWNLQMDCMKDLIYWVAKVNERHVLEFGRKIKETLSKKMATGKNTDEKDDECWTKYRQMMDVNMLTNATYSTLFLISHLDTFLTFSYFLTQVLNEDATTIDVMIIGYDVLKGILPFFPARRASIENDQCRKWIQTLPCQTQRFRVGDTAYTREVMLWELKEDCLGLGSGRMHINNEFIVTFLTLVASLFCFLLNLEQKKEPVIRY